ncbi:MAG: hypothetical protein FJ090_01720 [Deltaproteobacteria bacterium]|nr:hypothetical protein [Deltaproteobacteria bacterium]
MRVGAPLRIGPERPRAAIVVVHAGASGLVERLRFLALPDNAFPRDALFIYEREPGTWKAPGNPVHVADARRAIERGLAEGVPTVVMSWSGGCVAAARAITETGAERIALFVDVEGPVDRFSLVPPGRDMPEWRDLSPFDEAPWAGRELLHLLPPCPYLRVQGRPDHVHGDCLVHADRIMQVATARCGWSRRLDVPGPLSRHGIEVARTVEAFLADHPRPR